MISIDHIAIYAKDMNNMIEFYSYVFAFKETERKCHENGEIKMVRLRINDFQCVELFNFDNQIGSSKGHVTSGYMHLGVKVEDIEKYVKILFLNNIKLDQDFIGSDGTRHVFFQDPEHNQIELSENKF